MSFRGPSLQHSIRKGTINNKTGDTFVITVPKIIAEQFQSVLLRVYVSGNSIILESGCKIFAQDINIHKQECYNGIRGFEYTSSGKKIYIK